MLASDNNLEGDGNNDDKITRLQVPEMSATNIKVCINFLVTGIYDGGNKCFGTPTG